MNLHDDAILTIFILLLRIILYGGTQVAEANGKKVADIYWNTSNPIFHRNNGAHIFVVQLRDSVDIICPKYSIGYPEERIEYSLIYMVDPHSYDSCTLDGKSAQIVGICTRPYIDQVITVVFREYTPNPGLLEFSSGQEYYFISTSDGSKSGLKNEQDGLCRHQNMRLRFVVEPWRRQSSGEGRSPKQESNENDDPIQSSPGSDAGMAVRGPPPLMLFPRGPIGRPTYGQGVDTASRAGQYAVSPPWNSRAFGVGPWYSNAGAPSRCSSNNPSAFWISSITSFIVTVFILILQ